MRALYAVLFTALLASPLRAQSVTQDDVSVSISQGRYKQAIDQLNHLLKDSNESKLQFELAEVYLLDQDIERSFQTFLNLLHQTDSQTSLYEPESTTYHQALDVYLNGTKPYVTANEIVGEYADYYSKHPDDIGVGFILATAYANQREYQRFYRMFYPLYLQSPHHYLAYKIRAALHIKLYERSRSELEKEKQCHQIEHFAKKAILQYADDSTLHQWLITFCPDKEKASFVKQSIEQLINGERAVPRNDIPFYVQQAINTDQLELAQKFIDQAKEWYQYSRVIDAAQNHLDQKKNQES
jgi:hypothetical protein